MLAIGNQKVERPVRRGIDRTKARFGLGRRRRPQHGKRQLPARSRRVVLGKHAPIQQPGHHTVLRDRKPGPTCLDVTPPDDARHGAKDSRRFGGARKVLVPIGGDDHRKLGKLPEVDCERAHAACEYSELCSNCPHGSVRRSMFQSIDDVIERFASERYICDRSIATVVFLAAKLQKPILVEGPAGVGKTELAKVLAGAVGHELIRLQCYEGLDEAKALYEWEYAKQLLYTQILKDKISDVLDDVHDLNEAVDRVAQQDDAFFSERFIVPRPLLRAISSTEPCVLLIDEIDKADTEFEAFLLEILSDFQVSVPELGTLKAKHIPLVVLTSNNAREMSDALKRRCLHLYIDFPDREQERAIVLLKVPGVAERLADEVVTAVQVIRKLDLKKAPSISETLDWTKALTLLNVDTLDSELVNDTLSTILKYEGDIRKAQQELKEHLGRERAKRVPPPAAAAAPAKDVAS